MATTVVTPPSSKTKSETFTKNVDDIMIGPLTTNKEPARTRTPMCWLSENIKELVQETGNSYCCLSVLKTAEQEAGYGKVLEFLLD